MPAVSEFEAVTIFLGICRDRVSVPTDIIYGMSSPARSTGCGIEIPVNKPLDGKVVGKRSKDGVKWLRLSALSRQRLVS